MISLPPAMLSTPFLLVALVAVFAMRRIHYELTTGARRRKMIRENGCQPVVHYQHQGILGKLFGVDVIHDLVSSARVGQMHQRTRIRNYSERSTIQFRMLFTECESIARFSEPSDDEHSHRHHR